MHEDYVDSFGAAWVKTNYVSAPFVRIAATRTELIIVGRWWWVPIPPTVVPRSDAVLRPGRQVIYRRFTLEEPEGRIWTDSTGAKRLEELGWTVSSD